MRIALAQLNPIIGDVAGNAARLREAIDQAKADGADLLISAEMALLGYPPRDLIFRQGVVEACEKAVKELAAYAGELPLIIGHPRREPTGTRPLRNSASVCRQGRVTAIYDKRLLPGYDIFDEDRYFDAGNKPMVVEIAGQKLGILICEDIWRAGDVEAERRYSTDPVAETVEAGCDLIVTLNATPFVHGKWIRHLQQISDTAEKYGVPVVMVNQVGGFDDLIFDGRSFVVDERGELKAMLPGWGEHVQTIDLADSHNEQALRVRDRIITEPLEELFEALVLGIRDYCHKTGHHNVLIGLSGGIDSALTATIAAAALGANHVSGVMMPSKFSSQGSLEDAQALAENLGLAKCETISIEALHEAARTTLEGSLGQKLEGLPDENIQARMRGLLLMACANAHGSLVLATGNKSELAVGYSTLYGDMCGALSVIGDVLKTKVYDLSKWINRHHDDLGFTQPPIPEASIEKVPSAELRPDQTDQDSLPPYDLLDEIIARSVEHEESISKIVDETGYEPELVERVTRMIDMAEYKRNQAAVILKISTRAFGPGRPWPLVMRSETCCKEEAVVEEKTSSHVP